MELISKQVLDLWNKYKPTIAVDAIEYDRELKKLLGTNLASLGTDCSEFPNNSDAISRQSVIDVLDETRRIAEQNIDGAVLMTFERVLDSLVNITNALPTIQPEPYKGGDNMRYCRIKGKLCVFATEWGYCSFTVCKGVTE